jgi:hypothetical protein
VKKHELKYVMLIQVYLSVGDRPLIQVFTSLFLAWHNPVHHSLE